MSDSIEILFYDRIPGFVLYTCGEEPCFFFLSKSNTLKSGPSIKQNTKMAAAVKRVEAEEFTTLALETYGFNPYLQKHQVEERVSEFRSFFGVSPLTCEQTWDALIQLNLVHKRSRPVHLLLTLRFLRGYPKEKELMKDFHIRDQRTIRKWIKQYTSHMKLVLATKVG